MKNLIVQFYDQKPFPKWAAIAKSRFEKYAQTFDAEYLFYNKAEYANVPYFENLNIIYNDRFNDYDKILFVDMDVVPDHYEENIFDEEINDVGLVPEHKPKTMSATPTHMLAHVEMEYRKACNKFMIPIRMPKTVDAPYLMFNSGMILWSKKGRTKARRSFMDWNKWYSSSDNRFVKLDQPFINGQVQAWLNYKELDHKWNGFPRFRFDRGPAPRMNFIHYTGGKKKYIEEEHDMEILNEN